MACLLTSGAATREAPLAMRGKSGAAVGCCLSTKEPIKVSTDDVALLDGTVTDFLRSHKLLDKKQDQEAHLHLVTAFMPKDTEFVPELYLPRHDNHGWTIVGTTFGTDIYLGTAGVQRVCPSQNETMRWLVAHLKEDGTAEKAALGLRAMGATRDAFVVMHVPGAPKTPKLGAAEYRGIPCPDSPIKPRYLSASASVDLGGSAGAVRYVTNTGVRDTTQPCRIWIVSVRTGETTVQELQAVEAQMHELLHTVPAPSPKRPRTEFPTSEVPLTSTPDAGAKDKA